MTAPAPPMLNDKVTSGQVGPKCGKEADYIATKTNTAPIISNKHVKELLAVLRENNSPQTQDFLAVLTQVGAMEKQLDAAVSELAAMRRELAEAQKQNHPVKTAMQKAVIVMQNQVLDLRDKLTELKGNAIDGCKNAVAAFKEKGINALDNVAHFFKVKPLLENMRDSLERYIRHDDKAIAKIEAISTEYHAAGQHMKNMGLTMLGKEAAQETKPPGKLAAVISFPFRQERRTLFSLKKIVDAAIGNLAHLEDRAKPSIKKTIQAHNEKAAQTKKDVPEIDKPRPAVAER